MCSWRHVPAIVPTISASTGPPHGIPRGVGDLEGADAGAVDLAAGRDDEERADPGEAVAVRGADEREDTFVGGRRRQAQRDAPCERRSQADRPEDRAHSLLLAAPP